MKILFVLTKISSKARWHQGLASLATYTRVRGHTADLLEIDDFDLARIEDQVRAYGPDLVAATANSHQFLYVPSILEHLKKRLPRLCTVLGGVHVTIAPESVRNLTGIDAICRGEGEDPLLRLVSTVEQGDSLAEIDNMWFPGRGESCHTPCRYYVEDLSMLPIVHRDLFRIYRDADRNRPLPFRPRFLFSRGCPFNCSYCCNKPLKEAFPKSAEYVRWTTVDKAIEELEAVSYQYRFSDYVIDDDTFTLKKKWLLEFCNKYPDTLRSTKQFEVNARVGTVDEEMMKALKDAGCNLIKFGLESGDEGIRQKVLNRRITDEMIIDMARMAEKVGIRFHSFNMVGIPGESTRSILKTIKLNRLIRPQRVQVTVFYPYSHTELGDSCIANGMVISHSDNYFQGTTLKHDKLSRTQINLFAKLFKLLVYSGYSWKDTIVELKVVSRPMLRIPLYLARIGKKVATGALRVIGGTGR